MHQQNKISEGGRTVYIGLPPHNRPQ